MCKSLLRFDHSKQIHTTGFAFTHSLIFLHESVVASAILCAVACWGSRLRLADANRLNKLIQKVSDVVRMECDSDGGVREEDAD